MIKEAVVETIQQVEQAISNGANRIELCDNLTVGGTTPSVGMVEIATEICHANRVEIAIMIRPRGGDFVYNLYDFENQQFVLMFSFAIHLRLNLASNNQIQNNQH